LLSDFFRRCGRIIAGIRKREITLAKTGRDEEMRHDDPPTPLRNLHRVSRARELGLGDRGHVEGAGLPIERGVGEVDDAFARS
jgi:hypothetical protein